LIGDGRDHRGDHGRGRGTRPEAVALRGDVAKDGDCRAMAGHRAPGLRPPRRADQLRPASRKFAALDDLDALAPDDFLRLYSVNTIGVFLMARACRAALVASGDGAIVNVSSLCPLTGGGSSLAYAASKGALNTLTLSLARVFAPKVRVNAVCPALIAGGFVQRAAPEFYEQRQRLSGGARATAAHRHTGRVARSIFAIVTAMPLTTGEIISLDVGFHLNGR